MLALTAGAQFIGITNDYRALFDEDNPQLLAFNALEDEYFRIQHGADRHSPRGKAPCSPVKRWRRSRSSPKPLGSRPGPFGWTRSRTTPTARRSRTT